MLLIIVIIYNFSFLGTPIKVDITRYLAVPKKTCPTCGFEIRREHMPKVKKPKLDTDSPKWVPIVESSQLKLFSVQVKSTHNSVFVVQSSSDFVCHSEKCTEKRAVYVATGVPFSIEHCNLVASCSLPASAYKKKTSS